MNISKLLKKIKTIGKKLPVLRNFSGGGNKKILPLILLVLLTSLQFPHLTLAQTFTAQDQVANTQTPSLGFPEAGPRAPREVRYMTLTAYNSLKGQTDQTPCLSASGLDLCANDQENVIAINGLPFGTLVRFPDLFGDQVFKVADRMNARYSSHRGDIWLKDLADAKDFGVKYQVKAEIL